eukprot:349682-Chlamydomonas_euryale.AAC.29
MQAPTPRVWMNSTLCSPSNVCAVGHAHPCRARLAHTAQVWKNCTLYNPPMVPVRVQGDQLSDLWERCWLESNIEVWGNAAQRSTAQRKPAPLKHVLECTVETSRIVNKPPRTLPFSWQNPV